MLPDPLSGFGAASRQGRGWAGKRRQREVEGGPKLLLNQGPSEPCYATALQPGLYGDNPLTTVRFHQRRLSNQSFGE